MYSLQSCTHKSPLTILGNNNNLTHTKKCYYTKRLHGAMWPCVVDHLLSLSPCASMWRFQISLPWVYECYVQWMTAGNGGSVPGKFLLEYDLVLMYYSVHLSLGSGHKTMVCAVCLYIFLWHHPRTVIQSCLDLRCRDRSGPRTVPTAGSQTRRLVSNAGFPGRLTPCWSQGFPLPYGASLLRTSFWRQL